MAKKKKQEEPELPAVTQKEFPATTDVESIGNPNGDPCFGTKYDLTTDECKMCGDSELCCIKFAASLGKTRKELEKENNYKDLEILVDIPAVKKTIRQLKKKGEDRVTIRQKLQAKYGVTEQEAKQLYKQYKPKKK